MAIAPPVPVATVLVLLKVIDVDTSAGIAGAVVVYTLVGSQNTVVDTIDANGFSTQFLIPGTYRIVITPQTPSYQAVVIQAVVIAGVQPNVVRLKKTKTTMRVALTDKATNLAIAGCTVTISQGGNGALAGTTDTNGSVTFSLNGTAIDPDALLQISTGLIGSHQPVEVQVVPNLCLAGNQPLIKIGLD